METNLMSRNLRKCILPLAISMMAAILIFTARAEEPAQPAAKPAELAGENAVTAAVPSADGVFYLPAKDAVLRNSGTAETIDDVKTADVVIVCVGFAQSPPVYTEGLPEVFDHEGEGNDRPYALPPGQPELIRAAAELNPKTIVILNAGGSVATEDWIEKAPALLHAFYPGQEGGTAIAEILFGKTTPSGKLAFSWEKRWKDSAAYGNYPSYDENPVRCNTYKEGVFLGYRWFDSQKIEPLFPFGFGLSYTRFAYSGLTITAGKDGNYTARAVIKNTGTRPGAEVVQLYVQPPAASVPRPLRELKGFTRVELAPGESKTVSIALDRHSLAYWDPGSKQWTVTPGHYVVAVGTSSAKLNLQAPLASR